MVCEGYWVFDALSFSLTKAQTKQTNKFHYSHQNKQLQPNQHSPDKVDIIFVVYLLLRIFFQTPEEGAYVSEIYLTIKYIFHSILNKADLPETPKP